MLKSKRLMAIAKVVPTNKKVFDIGSDHGLLAVHLSRTNKVVATDISKSCVNKMQTEFENKKINNIEVVLSDGLHELDIDKDDVIVIAGIGTTTILSILNEAVSKMSNHVIISSHNNHYTLRKRMIKLGFYIADEKVIYENNRYYVIHSFERGKGKYTTSDYLFGITGRKNKDYMLFLYNVYTKAYNKIPFKFFVKKISTKHIINMIEKELRKSS